jgi:hypothetical protein
MIEWNDEVAMAIENRIDAQILRIDDIERKQAKRFPHLIERLDRIENAIPAIVDRLNDLERSILRLENNDSGMDYSGAFETDIKYG